MISNKDHHIISWAAWTLGQGWPSSTTRWPAWRGRHPTSARPWTSYLSRLPAAQDPWTGPAQAYRFSCQLYKRLGLGPSAGLPMSTASRLHKGPAKRYRPEAFPKPLDSWSLVAPSPGPRRPQLRSRSLFFPCEVCTAWQSCSLTTGEPQAGRAERHLNMPTVVTAVRTLLRIASS